MAAITTYTRADLRQRLADRYEQVPFWADEDANDALNESLLLWNFLTGQWRTSLSLVALANTWDYDLTSALLFGARVSYNSQPLDSTSLWELEQGRPNWRNETTASGGDVPTKPQLWAPVSLLYIHIWPSPATTTGSFLVEGVAATPQLLSETATVDLGEESLTPLLQCALHLVAFSEGSDRFVTTEGSWLSFLRAAIEQNSQLSQSATFRRYLGLDRGRDLRPTRGAPTRPAPSLTGGGR